MLRRKKSDVEVQLVIRKRLSIRDCNVKQARRDCLAVMKNSTFPSAIRCTAPRETGTANIAITR